MVLLLEYYMKCDKGFSFHVSQLFVKSNRYKTNICLGCMRTHRYSFSFIIWNCIKDV